MKRMSRTHGWVRRKRRCKSSILHQKFKLKAHSPDVMPNPLAATNILETPPPRLNDKFTLRKSQTTVKIPPKRSSELNTMLSSWIASTYPKNLRHFQQGFCCRGRHIRKLCYKSSPIQKSDSGRNFISCIEVRGSIDD